MARNMHFPTISFFMEIININNNSCVLIFKVLILTGVCEVRMLKLIHTLYFQYVYYLWENCIAFFLRNYIFRICEHVRSMRTPKKIMQAKWGKGGNTERLTEINVVRRNCRGYKETGNKELVEGGG